MKKQYYGYLFISPFFIFYLIFGLYPAITTFRLAFYQYDMNMPTDNYVGFQYITTALKDKYVWNGMLNAFKYWAVGTFLVQFTALTIAAVLTFFKVRFKHFFKSSFYLPSIVSTAVVATIFSLFMGYPSGVMNQLLMRLNVISEPQMFKTIPMVVFCVIIFISWWMGFGSTTIMVNAGMTSVGEEYYEAAIVDGANVRQIFTKITIPLIWPILTYLWLTSLIWGLQAFDIQYMITDSTAGGPNGVAQTIAMYIYRHGFEVGNVGYAAGISTVFFVVILVLSFIMFKILNRVEAE